MQRSSQVTNHYPYILDKKNKDIEAWKTGDDTVDPIFKLHDT